MYRTSLEKRLYVVELKINKSKKDYKYTIKDKLALAAAVIFIGLKGPNMRKNGNSKSLIETLKINYVEGSIICFLIGLFIVAFVILGLRTQHKRKLKKLVEEKTRLETLIKSEKSKNVF